MKALQTIRSLGRTASDVLNAWVDTDMVSDPAPVFVALNELFAAYDPGLVPQAQHGMQRVLTLCEDWQARRESDDAAPITDGLATELGHVVEKLNAEAPRLEWSTPSEMAVAGVPSAAICRTWRINEHDLERELKQPGSVVNAEHIARIEREVQRLAGFGPDVAITWQAPSGPVFNSEDQVEDEKPIGPTLDTMIVDGCNLNQIRRWHPNVTPQEIAKRAAELGVKPDHSQKLHEKQYAIPTTDFTRHPEIQVGSPPEAEDDRTAEVLRLHGEGLGVRRIAQETGLKLAEVKEIIRRAAAEAELAAQD